MSAKSNKIELSGEFMVMWREEQTLWDVMSPSYRDKNEKSQKFQKQPLEVFFKKGVLRNFANSQKNTCARVSFLIKVLASRNF